jgi:4a-hydroxytetrahydrobiopterin dehydratase
MEPLKNKRCIPCEGGVEPLTGEQAKTLQEQTPQWKLSEDGKSISREFIFDDFAQALAFTDKVGAIAQEEWHHPDVRLSWGKVGITLSTHAIKGLSENDFIVAAKIDGLLN